MKENILGAKEIIGNKTRFFPILFSLMKKYSMNNLLHNEIISNYEKRISDLRAVLINKEGEISAVSY